MSVMRKGGHHKAHHGGGEEDDCQEGPHASGEVGALAGIERKTRGSGLWGRGVAEGPKVRQAWQ